MDGSYSSTIKLFGAWAITLATLFGGGYYIYQSLVVGPSNKPMTVEQSYAALKFDTTAFPAIVCEAYGDTESLHTVKVQYGERCVPNPTSTTSAETYDSIGIGTHVVLKVEKRRGEWWARPVGKKF